ncbi:hypothetical protein AMATHDRAFT_3141 [Amanita thiersii Skay4041]|uniref:non-specific serine/threonine protein kinase n=1 Tax=Amanita thiersii Skay4041 TaxID=703135 RepID=A0A2A9NMG1_9AGAR|nr:hypothetical protein AMATHDRAFT_3141 [Amanita thiersii Skay4041]
MLGPHTKQINTYGKRSHRIISHERSVKEIPNIFDEPAAQIQWAPIVSKMRKRENAVGNHVPKSQSRVIHVQRKKPTTPVISPLRKIKSSRVIEDSQRPGKDSGSKKPPSATKLQVEIEPLHPIDSERTPLANYPLNVPSPPIASTRLKHASARRSALKLLKPSSKVIDMDIITLDEDGNAIAKERRVSHTNVEVNSINRDVSTRPQRHQPMVDDSLENGEIRDITPDRPVIRRPQKKVAPNRIYSDESSSEEDESFQCVSSLPRQSISPPYVTNVHHHNNNRRNTDVRVQVTARSAASTAIITPSHPKGSTSTGRAQRVPSPIIRPRQLTPIRNGGSTRKFNIPQSPPTPSDFDELSLDFEDLSIDYLSFPSLSSDSKVPEYLIPLLQECHQEDCGLHEFSAFIESFPYDPIVRSSTSHHNIRKLGFKKIGEASYSEVFGIGDVVLKIIPLRDELAGHNGIVTGPRENARSGRDEREGPAPSDAKDVRKEIIVTRAMGEVCDGFVKLLKSYVVRGRYPELLLQLWDEFNETRGSESIRPDTFTVSQVYAIIVLPNGGPDLEAYTFSNPSRTGWRQACSLFWQVSKALAHAEQLVSFEHRDLHWGQILVKDLPTESTLPLKSLNVNQRSSLKIPEPQYMDDIASGIQATVIDLGLARMDATDSTGQEKVYWTPFDEEIFMGEGDYQFDIYRIMRHHTGDDWEVFEPLTNVMWLHYLVLKLLQSKNLKPPGTRSSQTTSFAFTEKQCYDSLLEVERWLSDCIANIAPKKKVPKVHAHKKTRASTVRLPTVLVGPRCAADVIQYGMKKSWIMPLP